VSDRNFRKPFGNFFIKKSLQFRFTIQILLIFLVCVFATTVSFMHIYNSKSREGSFYYMSNDIMQDLQLKSILVIVLPPVVAAELIAVLLAFGIGLFSSRKIAVPVYKIEKWAAKLKNGKLNTTLAFREEDRLKELAVQCNAATDFYRQIFSEIKTHTENISEFPTQPEKVIDSSNRIKELLSRIDL